MPFKSRKQQQWYHATDQDYLDGEPHAARKVEGEAGDLTTTPNTDIPEESNLFTGASGTEVTEEEKELKRGEQTPISQDDLEKEDDGLLEFEGKMYAEVKGNEEVSSVSGPSDGMRVMDDDVLVLPEGKIVPPPFKKGEGIILNENYIVDQFGQHFRPVYIGESKDVTGDDILIFENKYYTSEGLGNCEFCQGAGKITVERLGLKDCPDCDGTGDVQTPAPMMDGGINPNMMEQQPMVPQDPSQQTQDTTMNQPPSPQPEIQQQEIPQQELGGMPSNGQIPTPPQQLAPQQQQPTAIEPEQLPQEVPQRKPLELGMPSDGQISPAPTQQDPTQPTNPAQIPQQPSVDPQEQSQPMERPEDKKPKFGESKQRSKEQIQWDINNIRDKSSADESKIKELEREKKGEGNPNHADDGKFSSNGVKDDVGNIKIDDIGKGGFGPDKQGRTEDDPMYGMGSNNTPNDIRREYEDNIKGFKDEIKGGAPEDFVNQKIADFKDKLEKLNDRYPPKAKESKKCACETSVKKYKLFIRNQLDVLKKRAKAGEAVGIMYGLPTIEKEGRKIKGTLAYAGVSLNDRIYLPEELRKGHGKTLPLLLNHSSIAGAEEELDRLSESMLDYLYEEKDFQVGEVKLNWDPEKLTLFYEGIIEDKFFQKEVDDMKMSVSLGIYYDSDSPRICDESCYTVIKGAEFREVSLVYHAGFPIATIEAVEAELMKKSMEDIHHGAANTVEDTQIVDDISDQKEAVEDHLKSLDDLKEEEKEEGEPEHVKDVQEIIDDVKEKTVEKPEVKEELDQMPDGELIDVIPKEEPITTESFIAPTNFSVNGVNTMTISNINGIEKYKLDGNSFIHMVVDQGGANIRGENMIPQQLQPKMGVPDKLAKEIENKPKIKIEDNNEF